MRGSFFCPTWGFVSVFWGEWATTALFDVVVVVGAGHLRPPWTDGIILGSNVWSRLLGAYRLQILGVSQWLPVEVSRWMVRDLPTSSPDAEVVERKREIQVGEIL